MNPEMTQPVEVPAPSMDRLFKRAVLVGVAAFVPCIAWGLVNPAQFFRSYLLAWLFCMAVMVVTSLAVSLDVSTSPPPDTFTAFVTEAGALAATLTAKIMEG